MAGFFKKIKDKISDNSKNSNNSSTSNNQNDLDNAKPSQNTQQNGIIDYDKVLNESNENNRLKMDLPKDFAYGTTLTNENFEVTSASSSPYKEYSKISDFYIKDKKTGIGMVITTINSNLKDTADIVFNYCNRLSQVDHVFTLLNRNELFKNPNLLKLLETNAKLDALLNENPYMQKKVEQKHELANELVAEQEKIVNNLENGLENNFENKENNNSLENEENQQKVNQKELDLDNDLDNFDNVMKNKINVVIVDDTTFLLTDERDQFASVSLEKCEPNLFKRYISTKDDINEVTKELDKISEYCTSSKTKRTQKIIDFIEHEETEKEGGISKNSNETKENEINREVYEEGDIVVLTPQEYEPNYLENHTEAEIKADQNKYYLLDYSTGEVASLTALSYSKEELQTLANDSDSIEDIKEVVEEYEASLHDEFDMSDLSQENAENIQENALGDFEEFDELENYTDLDDLDDYEDRDM